MSNSFLYEQLEMLFSNIGNVYAMEDFLSTYVKDKKAYDRIAFYETVLDFFLRFLDRKNISVEYTRRDLSSFLYIIMGHIISDSLIIGRKKYDSDVLELAYESIHKLISKKGDQLFVKLCKTFMAEQTLMLFAESQFDSVIITEMTVSDIADQLKDNIREYLSFKDDETIEDLPYKFLTVINALILLVQDLPDGNSFVPFSGKQRIQEVKIDTLRNIANELNSQTDKLGNRFEKDAKKQKKLLSPIDYNYQRLSSVSHNYLLSYQFNYCWEESLPITEMDEYYTPKRK